MCVNVVLAQLLLQCSIIQIYCVCVCVGCHCCIVSDLIKSVVLCCCSCPVCVFSKFSTCLSVHSLHYNRLCSGHLTLVMLELQLNRMEYKWVGSHFGCRCLQSVIAMVGEKEIKNAGCDKKNCLLNAKFVCRRWRQSGCWTLASAAH